MPVWIVILILGIVEGITEFLPISSTGHLLIVERWLNSHQSELFNVVIQSGAVLAVIPLFPERMRQFIFRWREKATQDYAAKLILACIITGVPGFILEKKGLMHLTEELAPVAWALLIGGIAFVVIEAWLRGKTLNDRVTWTVAVAVGIGQLIAARYPGASRSGTTITFCLLLGLARPAATEFSFLVGIPTMLAASGLKIFKAIHHPPPGAAPENWGIVVLGFLVSAMVSFIAVKWLLRYIQTHTFSAFGWYRMVLGVAILIGVWIAPHHAAAPGASKLAPQPMVVAAKALP